MAALMCRLDSSWNGNMLSVRVDDGNMLLLSAVTVAAVLVDAIVAVES